MSTESEREPLTATPGLVLVDRSAPEGYCTVCGLRYVLAPQYGENAAAHPAVRCRVEIS